MSQSQQQFTRKQLAIIFKIAFLEAMALSIIIPSSQSVGEIPSISCPSGSFVSSIFPTACASLGARATASNGIFNVATTSTTCVSTGKGLGIIPTSTGRVNIFEFAWFKTNTTVTGWVVYLLENTLSIPSQGASCGTDTQIGVLATSTITPYANAPIPVPLASVRSDSIGTDYIYYLGMRCGGSNCQFSLLGLSGGGPNTLIDAYET